MEKKDGKSEWNKIRINCEGMRRGRTTGRKGKSLGKKLVAKSVERVYEILFHAPYKGSWHAAQTTVL